MTSDENIMSEMLERATSRESVDELALQMFCLVVRSNSQLISKAQEMLISKIRSTSETESTRAVALLEECMTKCGTEFQDEVSKFRFLNELIRLVSKKYQGDSTPVAIKQRIMECLLLWTTEFPQRSKIREAYDMLNKEGCVEHGTSTVAVGKRESVLGIDEEMLSKLIKSGDPENFKRANLLIQYRVNQESRRTELVFQHKSELREVQNTVGLLNQMLDTYEGDGCTDVDGGETMNLIRELYISCKKHKPILQRLPELIENTDESLIADTLETNDALQAVMNRYKDVVVHPPTKVTTTSGQTDLLSELLGIDNLSTLKTASTVSNGKTISKSTANTLDELNEIFGNATNDTKKETESKYPDELLGNIDLLQPVNVFTATEEEKDSSILSMSTEKPAFRELREIDKLSDELFKQNMQSTYRVGTFKKKEPEKVSLNDLVKEKSQVKAEVTAIPITPEKSSIETNEKSKASLNLEDDEILSLKTEVKVVNILSDNYPTVKENETPIIENVNKPFKHLTEIDIDLDKLTPYGTERVLVDDEDIKITMNFTEDRPSQNISVIVIAVSNKSKETLKDFQFEASVKKPCKVRLLSPTERTLPPFKPYRPPMPINQVLLLLNPTGKEIDVTCIFGYKLGEDPDPIKECIIAKSIPFVE